MGVAAWNRGSSAVARQIEAERRPAEFVLMDDLTKLPKFEHAQRPFGDIRFVAGNGGWWAECPATGRGVWYRTLRQAVRSWRVAIIGYANGVWQATPI